MRSAVYPERTCGECSRTSRRGFTLIELLIVISIIAILALMGIVNFKDYAAEQVAVKAKGQIQSMLRLAQTNATSSVLCNNQGSTSWSVRVNEDPNNGFVSLFCRAADEVTYFQKFYTLDNAHITVTGTPECVLPLPVILEYKSGTGTQNLSANGAADYCLLSPVITFNISNRKTPSASPTTFNVSKGGAIDVR